MWLLGPILFLPLEATSPLGSHGGSDEIPIGEPNGAERR